MPIYQYVDSRGRVIELRRTVAGRDDAPPGFRRLSVPDRIHAGTRHLLHPASTDATVRKALRSLEEKHVTPEQFTRETGYTPAQLKRIWFDET